MIDNYYMTLARGLLGKAIGNLNSCLEYLIQSKAPQEEILRIERLISALNNRNKDFGRYII